MIVINFAHPLTPDHHDQIATLTGQPVERVIDVPTHFDDQEPFAPQVTALVASVGLSAEEWQTLPLLVNLPSYAPIATAMLAYMHGLLGHFPSVIRMGPTEEDIGTRFEMKEILNLTSIRHQARRQRG